RLGVPYIPRSCRRGCGPWCGASDSGMLEGNGFEEEPMRGNGMSARSGRQLPHPAALIAAALLALPLAACAPPADTLQEPTVTLATGLDAPWSVVRLDDGGAVISQRDDGKVLELTASGDLRDAGVVPEVVSGGEAGLNGLAMREIDGIRWLYAYHATADDNRVVRMPLTGASGSLRLDLEHIKTVIDGI